jgi:hypothetical protein
MTSHCGENLVERERAGPIADKLMSVGRAVDGDRRDCAHGRCRADPALGAWLGRRRECLRVGKVVRVAKTFRVPMYQGTGPRSAGGTWPASMSDKRLRCRKLFLGVRIGGSEKEVSGGDVYAAATAQVAQTPRHRMQPTAEGVSGNLDVAIVEQRVVEGDR